VGEPFFPRLVPAVCVALFSIIIGLETAALEKSSVKPARASERQRGVAGVKPDLNEIEKEALAVRWRKWESANNRMQCGDYSEAIKLYNDLISTASKKTKKEHLAFMYGQRGYARMLGGELKAGVSDASKALELDPDSVWIRKNRALAYRKLGLFAQSQADMQIARQVENDPKYQKERAIFGHYRDALESRSQDKPEEVIRHAQQLIKDQPQSTAPYFMLGDAYFESGKFMDALNAFNKSLAINPDDPYVLNYRGTTYAKLGQNDKAVADYSRVIAIRKKLTSKKWDEIVGRYAGKFLAPGLSELYTLRGELYLKMGEKEKAIADCSEAIRLNSGDWHNFEIRAKCHQAAGNGKLAAQDIHRLNLLRGKR